MVGSSRDNPKSGPGRIDTQESKTETKGDAREASLKHADSGEQKTDDPQKTDQKPLDHQDSKGDTKPTSSLNDSQTGLENPVPPGSQLETPLHMKDPLTSPEPQYGHRETGFNLLKNAGRTLPDGSEPTMDRLSQNIVKYYTENNSDFQMDIF
jgi:FtsZ-interacting cell division protein ZipA